MKNLTQLKHDKYQYIVHAIEKDIMDLCSKNKEELIITNWNELATWIKDSLKKELEEAGYTVEESELKGLRIKIN